MTAPPLPGLDADTLDRLRRGLPVTWTNPAREPAGRPSPDDAFEAALHDEARAATQRLARQRPLLRTVFPELAATGGVIESPLLAVPDLQAALGLPARVGRLLVKADHLLPVAGSVKARGGLHEVLDVAERLALAHGLPVDDGALASPAARALFAGHTVAVGSTGNLGLAIGIAAAALGFRAVVHMSAEAKAWKKDRLRRRGVTVVEHAGDYAQAVAAGRAQAAADPRSHFVDDEASRSLFAGYAAAAAPLAAQLAAAGVTVDATHPLFVHLPCGVGGAPGGIASGLAREFGPHVHVFFAEPVQSPCVLLALAARPGDPLPSVYDLGLTNRTEADGLAVPRASPLAVAAVRPTLAGAYTVDDDALFRHVVQAQDSASLALEPSATAGLSGPHALLRSDAGRRWLDARSLAAHLPRATHLAWTTGGALVPPEEHARFLARGRALPPA